MRKLNIIMVASKTSSKKAKGIRLENKCAADLRSAGFKSAKRQPMSGAIPGFNGDLFCLELPIVWELKNQESWSPEAYMRQAESSALKTNKIAAVVMSRNNFPDPYVVIKWSDFLNILQRAFIENSLPIATGERAFTKQQQLKRV